MEKEIIIENNKQYTFYIIRKKVKNINLRVNKQKQIIITIPKKVSKEYAKLFVIKNVNWIDKQLLRMENLPVIKESLEFYNGEITYILGKEYKIQMLKENKNQVKIEDNIIKIQIKESYINNKQYIQKVFEKWQKEYFAKILNNLVIQYKEKLNTPMPNIQIRKMKSKWGSCMPSKNKVTFNLLLIKTPIYCIEYVVLHELSHYKHMNHSKRFYDLVSKFMPDWKERRRILNKQYSNII